MNVQQKVNPIPFDLKEVMDILYGIEAEEEFSTFMRGRDVRRKATDSELTKVPGEKKTYHTFGNLKKINF